MRPRLRLFTWLVVLTAITVVMAARAHRGGAYQHAANGGFERGFDGWSISPNAGAAIAGFDEVAPAEGAASARVTVDGGVAVMRYAITGSLAAGTYEVAVSVRSFEPRTNVAIAVQPSEANEQRLDVVSGEPGAEWSELAGPVTLSHALNATILLLIAGPPGAVVYVDDVRLDGVAPVTLTPTPTGTPTAPLAASGEATVSATARPATPVPSPTASAVADVIAAELRNPGFEQIDASGAPSAWEKYGGALSSGQRARTGAYAARLVSDTASTKWLHQAVTVAGARWYAFEAWVLDDDAAVAAAFLRISWYASADASGAAIATADSTSRIESPRTAYALLTTGAVQAPDEARSARVRIMVAPVSEARAEILIDDAWFGGVDAPAASPTPKAATATLVPGSTPATAASRTLSGRRPAGPSSRQGAAAQVISEEPADGASSAVVVNEVLYDADSDVPDADAEWVELYNRGDTPTDVTGWSLRDAASADVLPSLVVPARGFAIVAATDAFAAQYPDVDGPVAILGGRIGNGLGNDGDRLLLVDPAGRVVDAVSWGTDDSVLRPSVGDVPEGHSIERRIAGVDSNSAGDFVDNQRPSPGRPYEAAVANSQRQARGDRVDILAGSPGRSWDWFPWVLAAASGAVLVVTAGWRGVWFVRERVRRP